MEIWRDKTKATHFNQQALVAFYFFLKIKKNLIKFPYRLPFNGTIIKVLHHA